MEPNDNIQLFENRRIRTAWDEEKEEWYFSIVDVVAVLTDQPDQRGASNYWAKLKQRLKEEGANQLLTNCQQLKMKSPKDGKRYNTDVADTEHRNWLDAYSLNKLDQRVMSGTGDAIIEIGTTANDSASVRTGNVVLTIGDKDYTIAVTKLATTPVITLDDTHVIGTHIDFSAAESSQGVRFITNDNWKVTAVNGVGAGVTTDPATWLSFSNASDVTGTAITGGSGSMILKIAAEAQTETGGVVGAGADPRSATVTIKCDHQLDGTDDPTGTDNPTIVLTIYQAGIEATPAPVVP